MAHVGAVVAAVSQFSGAMAKAGVEVQGVILNSEAVAELDVYRTEARRRSWRVWTVEGVSVVRDQPARQDNFKVAGVQVYPGQPKPPPRPTYWAEREE
jgi:hypothetical protein